MSKNILIVEDDKNLAESLKNLFISKKMNVRVSFSGQQAEHLMTLEQYDLLLVDVVLPKLNGLDFIRQVIAKKLIHSSCPIWVISGVLKKHTLSKDITNHIDEFLEKPLNLRTIEKKIDHFLLNEPQNVLKSIQFFYKWNKNKSNLLKTNKYIIKGHELMFICFYLYTIRFNGALSIHYQKQIDEILFYEGKINSFKTKDEESYLGNLLIKNNLVSEKEIQKLLKKKTNKPLGNELVDSCYISPHQLNKVLKEQLAIRLFKAMNHGSIVVSCQDFTVSRQFDQFAELEIKDYLSLIHNWIQSKVSVKWLTGFFENCEALQLKPLVSAIPVEDLSRYSNMKFFSQPVPHSMSILEFLGNREKAEGMRELYCRLLVRQLVIETTPTKNISQNNYKIMKKKYQSFLQDANKKTYFELMNLPVNAPAQKIEEASKNLIKLFHPDRRSKTMPLDLQEICDECFLLVQQILQTLTDPIKRQEYTKKIGKRLKKDDFAVQETYMEGRKNLKKGLYAEALNQFESIFKDKTAPGDAVLYYISAKLKNKKSSLSTQEREQISHLFETVSLEYQQSALFFFSKALFKKATGDKKSAFEFFTKSILLDPTLTIARVERHNLDLVRKKKTKANSFLNMFKKGA